MKNKEFEVSYHNDVFLKYAMLGEGEDATYIRNALIKYMTDIEPITSKVENSELDTEISDQTSIILEVHMKNEEGIEIDMNVQVSPFIRSTRIPFSYYIAKMFKEILVDEEALESQKRMIQVMLRSVADSEESKLIERYRMYNDFHEVEIENPLICRNHVNLFLMDCMVKEKGIESLDEFEQMCYLLVDNKNLNKIKTKSMLVQKLMKKYEEMKLDEHAWTLAKSREEENHMEENKTSNNSDSLENDDLVMRRHSIVFMLDRIVEEKKEDTISEIEKICYSSLGIVDTKKFKESNILVQLLMKKYEEMRKDKPIWEYALAREEELRKNKD